MMRHFGPAMSSWPIGGWGMALIMIGVVVFSCLLTVTVVLMHRYATGQGRISPAVGVSPPEVLAQRFARGELDEEEYVHRLQVLNDTAS